MIRILILKVFIAILCLLAVQACNTNQNQREKIAQGSDPNFKIIANRDIGFESFNRKVVVFGIDIYAVPKVEDSKLLHAANVMAQYLDNDENGQPDDSLLIKTLKENKAFLVMWKDESDLDFDPPLNRLGQDLGNDETIPDFVKNGKNGLFDASLEEVLHLINGGHALTYPEEFGLNVGSELANAMDIARGGQFIDLPKAYPAEAWYTYDDETCEYEDCMTTEYLYWAITSMLGAQANRLKEIAHEWKLNTREKVSQMDTAIFKLLSEPKYKMPTILPDGSYMKSN